jgi:hypothetical protein
MGRCLGRWWMIFLWVPWGGRGRGLRKRLVTFSRVVFHWTTRVFKQTHFLCYILCFRTITNGVPDPRCPGQTRDLLKFRQPDDLFHTMKTMKDQCLHGTVDMWFIFYVISVICNILCICVCTSYHCELVVGLRTQFYTLLEVWGDWELGG